MLWNESSNSQTSSPVSLNMTVKVSSSGLALMVGRCLTDVQGPLIPSLYVCLSFSGPK